MKEEQKAWTGWWCFSKRSDVPRVACLHSPLQFSSSFIIIICHHLSSFIIILLCWLGQTCSRQQEVWKCQYIYFPWLFLYSKLAALTWLVNQEPNRGVVDWACMKYSNDQNIQLKPVTRYLCIVIGDKTFLINWYLTLKININLCFLF